MRGQAWKGSTDERATFRLDHLRPRATVDFQCPSRSRVTYRKVGLLINIPALQIRNIFLHELWGPLKTNAESVCQIVISGLTCLGVPRFADRDLEQPPFRRGEGGTLSLAVSGFESLVLGWRTTLPNHHLEGSRFMADRFKAEASSALDAGQRPWAPLKFLRVAGINVKTDCRGHGFCWNPFR